MRSDTAPSGATVCKTLVNRFFYARNLSAPAWHGRHLPHAGSPTATIQDGSNPIGGSGNEAKHSRLELTQLSLAMSLQTLWSGSNTQRFRRYMDDIC